MAQQPDSVTARCRLARASLRDSTSSVKYNPVHLSDETTVLMLCKQVELTSQMQMKLVCRYMQIGPTSLQHDSSCTLHLLLSYPCFTRHCRMPKTEMQNRMSHPGEILLRIVEFGNLARGFEYSCIMCPGSFLDCVIDSNHLGFGSPLTPKMRFGNVAAI